MTPDDRGEAASASHEPTAPGLDTLGIPNPVTWSDDGEAVRMLDQRLLPEEERYVRLEDAEAVAEAIRSLMVRGAPAIGVAGAMGLALGASAAARGGLVGSELGDRLRALHDLLLATRPTGRDLGWALERMLGVLDAVGTSDPEALAAAMRGEADTVAREEADWCGRIGRAGLELVPDEGASVLTHCNAGALATCGIGTATAPLYAARVAGRPLRVLASETRPVLQGARLTAWELARAGVDVRVITDSMAGLMMQRGEVDLVITGADRIARNGDAANKIGTYALAVLARHHGIPFYIAAPRSTFDASLAGGGDIVIEERDPEEVRSGLGRRTVPEEVAVENPAFDVTPADLITAIVTDGGVLRPPYGPAIRDFLSGAAHADEGSPPEDETPTEES